MQIIRYTLYGTKTCNYQVYSFLLLVISLFGVSTFVLFQKFADVNFGLFTISWVLLRLMLFPYYVIYLGMFIRQSLQHSFVCGYIVRILYFPGGFMAGLTLVPPNLCLWFIIILLCILEVLHIYWFGLICNIVYRKLILHREVW